MSRPAPWAALALLSLAAPAACDTAALTARVLADRADYEARERLVRAYEQAGDHAAAYYQAAWLAWFAPRERSLSALAWGWLRDRRARDRAAAADQPSVSIVLAAVEARARLDDASLRGVIGQQATRLRRETERALDLAARLESGIRDGDPVARAALVHLCLIVDDLLVLEGDSAADRARRSVLREAAPRAAAVAAWLPDAPGAQLLLATVRARLADLEGGADRWAMAIDACLRAHELDPGDSLIPEMLWGLALRAGRWEEARQWQALVERSAPPAMGGERAKNR